MPNKNVNILLKLQDQFTRPMREAGTITRDQEKAMRKVSQSVIGFSRNVRSGVVSAIKHMAQFGAAAGAAAAALTTAAVKQYADYEQLTGGIQTLYEDLSWDVQEYASNAYKTAGLSANEYMETAMGFSASLRSSLMASEGNIRHMAEYTDMAITDMSDNANKFGTSMESIQNAYQGFAKQNYTMLDNLKLGYGGTKEEMQRLLSDAGKLTGLKYDISNFSDIVQAIHVIQGEIGVTGTTAKEAASTISGSIGMTKAAWSNLLVGMADPEADIDKLVDNLVSSAGTVVTNLAPVVRRTLVSLGKTAKALIPSLAREAGQLLRELLPPQALEAVEQIKAGVQKAWDMIRPVISFAAQHARTLIPAVLGVVGAISALSVVADITIKLYGMYTAYKELKVAIAGAKRAMGAANVAAFGPAILIIGGLIAAGVLLYKHWDVIKPKLVALKDKFTEVFGTIRTAALAVWDFLRPKLTALKDGFVTAVQAIGAVFNKVFPVIRAVAVAAVTKIIAAAASLREGWDRLKTALSALKDKFTTVFTRVRDVVTAAFDKIRSVAMPILDAIKTALEKIKSFIDTVKTGLGNLGFGGGSSWGDTPGSFQSLGGKALGTPYWRGGPTYVNEGRRGEIINLPSGTQIIPHDVSMAAAQSGGGRNVTVNVNIAGNVIGNREFMEQTGEYIVREIMNAWEVTA